MGNVSIWYKDAKKLKKHRPDSAGLEKQALMAKRLISKLWTAFFHLDSGRFLHGNSILLHHEELTCFDVTFQVHTIYNNNNLCLFEILPLVHFKHITLNQLEGDCSP